MYASPFGRFAWLALVTLAAGSAQAQTPAALRVQVDAAGSFSRSHPWSIAKQVTPSTADRFVGETQQLAYTLALTRGDAQDAGFRVTGTALIANDTASDAMVTSITLTYGGNPVAHACATGLLAAGTSRTCALDFAAPDAEARALVVDVDASGSVAGAEATRAVSFAAPTVSGASVTVHDTLLPAPLTFDESGTHTYTHDARCVDGNTVVVQNTATIVETGASDSATARVACHTTRMERSVASFGRQQWTWDLAKTHATALPLQVVAGQTYTVEYTITATASAAGAAGGVVHGAITAINTHPSADAVILSVHARINATDAVVTCPETMIAPRASYDANGDITVGRLTCPFTVTLAEGETPATVTGRVEHQLFNYDSAGNATAGSTRVMQGTQPVASLPAGASEDECIALVDVYLGQTHDLGEFCAREGNASVARTFSGTISVTANDACEYSIPNLARSTTNDTATRAEAATTITLERTDCVDAGPSAALQLGITGSGSFTRHYPWTIDKSVTPAASDRFIGETQELGYTLALTKGTARESGFRVAGSASITNTRDATVDVAAIDIRYGGTPVAHACATGPLSPGETRTCAVGFDTASAEPQSLAMRVTVRGDAAVGEASSAVAFGAPVVTGDRITVDDTLLAENLSFTQSGTHHYTHDASCEDGNTVIVENTATIVETGASDTAQARVACHALRMERSVAGPGDQSYLWNIVKTHGLVAPLTLAVGAGHDVTYSITATATPLAAGGAAGTVHGTITAINTHPVSDAVIVSVQAWINDRPATVSCPSPMLAPSAGNDADGSFQGGRLVCPFTLALPDGEAPATVSGRVEQQLFRYDHQNQATAIGTRVLQGTQPVGASTGGAVTDGCVHITDVFLGTVHDIGEFCASADALSVTRTFTGRITVDEDAGCEFSVPNTARLAANDSGAIDESTISVDVERSDCGAVSPILGGPVSPAAPVIIPSASILSLALLALLLGTVGAGRLSRREG